MLASNIHAQSNNKFNDAEIAAIAVTANEIDIKYAEIAKEKSNNEEILGFANTMIQDHNAVIEKAVELVNELGVKPQPNALSKKLNSDAEETRKMLRSKEGKVFNKAYIDNEVTYHKAVIDAIRNVLIPDTENNQLKELLQAVLPALETHLEHAKTVQQNFAGQ
ncbi:putative membrane protein [Fodinibius roseus]|uniref:Putative membrane protein n=2 Tax=Fodinibius roseus TaxID=1194090 RepID=A0A1M5K7K0_9BACT|nr:putative membrane protein [Fodinibius roseus]